MLTCSKRGKVPTSMDSNLCPPLRACVLHVCMHLARCACICSLHVYDLCGIKPRTAACEGEHATVSPPPLPAITNDINNNLKSSISAELAKKWPEKARLWDFCWFSRHFFPTCHYLYLRFPVDICMQMLNDVATIGKFDEKVGLRHFYVNRHFPEYFWVSGKMTIWFCSHWKNSGNRIFSNFEFRNSEFRFWFILNFPCVNS